MANTPKNKLPKNELVRLRNDIDVIDRQILSLLSKRGRQVVKIGKIKQALQSAFHVPEREEKIFASLRALNLGPYSNEAIEIIFREILSASLALESPLKVAYLGPEATFTHLASIKRFGLSAKFFPQESIPDVFQAVELGHTDYGVVPIENSTEGIVSYTLDLFSDHPQIKICGEIKIPIVHNLLSREPKLSSIRKIYSHSQALAQCRSWIESHLPEAKLIGVTSTAKAAEIVTREKNVAAIASEYAATHYHLKILQKHLEDHANNHTRFVVIGKQECQSTGKDKTSVMISTKDEPGILYQLLTPLAREKINLTKIESRPLKGRAWEYLFFVDLDGHQHDEKVSRALKAMEKYSSILRVLGSYPRGV